MTNFKKQQDTQASQAGEDVLDTLFSYASSRPTAPADDEAAIRTAIFAQWQKATVRRKRKRYLSALGLAASLVLTVIVVTNLQDPTQAVSNYEQLASLKAQEGDVFVHNIEDDNLTAHQLADGQFYANQVISTNTGARMALEWKTGESIRVDENSELALISISEIELISGRVYLDTKHVIQAGSSFVITTFAGPIRHLGTQYMAGIKGKTVTLSVREGEVYLDAANAEILVHKGEQVSIGPAGKPEVRPVQTFGRMWEWTSLVTPELNLDGLSAFEFIRWAGRESGREVEFLDVATKKMSMETLLRGKVNLSPDDALDLILLTSDIEAISTDEKILVRRRSGY